MDSFEKLALDSYGWMLDHELFKDIPEEDKLEILVEFSLAAVAEEYVNNYRIFPMTKEGVKEFKKIRDKGCCGSVNNRFKTTSGKYYLYGFNYGH